MLRTRTKQHRATPLNLNWPWYGPDAAGEYLYGDAQKGAKRLEWLRMAGGGPKFAKAGPRCVLYKREWLDEWLEQRSATSTAEAKAAGLHSR